MGKTKPKRKAKADRKAKIYFEEEGRLEAVKEETVSVIGYGNQGRSQALNMRDQGLQVVIGCREDDYSLRAGKDGFSVLPIPEAVRKASIIFLLLPDEVLTQVYQDSILPWLNPGSCLVFASGYTVAFGVLTPPEGCDCILLAPRMIGPGVRERFLSGQGYYSFCGIEKNGTGRAQERMLGLAEAIGTLRSGAVEVSFKEEATLDLFNEQAFGPAFGRVLLTAMDVLLEAGMPEEAVLLEMYLSGEMSHTYEKMARVGIVKQLEFHSHTSQYGALSRGVRYITLPLARKFRRSFREIISGSFAREWETRRAKLKLRVLKKFASRQRIGKIEERVRKALRIEGEKS